MTQELEVQELRREWEQWKSRTFWFLVASIGAFVGYGIWIGTMQTRVENAERNVAENKASISRLVDSQNVANISMASVLAKLSGIETTLSEIKATLKR